MIAADILRKIVDQRRNRINSHGHSMGIGIPGHRASEHVLHGDEGFTRKPFVICEVKRKSPSRGAISDYLDPVKQVGLYRSQGVGSISVLTEMDHFGGSLEDLMAVKTAFPDLAVLRKDFLLDVEDVDVSFRCGADAVLLIAAILEPLQLAELYLRCEELGLAALVEVHNTDELDVVRKSGIKPKIIGINARDLNTFQVDMLSPLKLRTLIDWECSVVFESGIFSPQQAALAASGGFDGVLVGEAAVKRAELASALCSALEEPENYPASSHSFWKKILAAKSLYLGSRPLVKICGITTVRDAHQSVELGADLLGFVFADSPRRADTKLLYELKDVSAIKVAVVTQAPSEDLLQLYRNGLIDVFQYHDGEGGDAWLGRGLPFFPALSVHNEGDIRSVMDAPSPRVLIDAYSAHAVGGTGRQIESELVFKAIGQKPLWLAGGLRPGTVGNAIKNFSPELIDASSGLEESPGKKDHQKLRAFFEEITHASV